MYIIASREDELINSAIESLLMNGSVESNDAYQYGKSYEWVSNLCKEVALAPSQTSISSHGGQWRVRFNKDHIYFLSDGWKDGEYLVFKARL